MRRPWLLLILVASLLVALLAAGCAGSGTSDKSPEDILTAAMEATEDMSSAEGTYEVTISFDADAGEMPEEVKAMIGRPMTVAGAFVYGNDPQAAEFTLSADLLGQAMDMGMRLLDGKAWLHFMDQWYEAPPEMTDALGDPAGDKTQIAQLQQMATDAGIDPMTWFKELRLVGEEKLDNVAVYHLTASPDLGKMITDLTKLMQNEDFAKLLDPSGSMDGVGGTDMSLPSPEELQEMETQIASMFQKLSGDIWIGKDDQLLRKATMGAKIVMPADEAFAEGLKGMDIAGTMLFKTINEPVSIQAPAPALPWSEFEKAMEENPGLFGGLGLF